VALLIACVVLAFSGCRARATVTIRLDDSGAGEVAARVTLDRAAVDTIVGLGGSLDEAVLLDGFAEAGWRIDPWIVDEESGRAVLVLRKQFVGAEQLERVLREIGGELVDVDVTIDRERGVLTSSDRLRVSVDATQLAVRVVEDPMLSERLGAAGLDVAAGDAELTRQLTRSLRVDLRGSVLGSDDAVDLRPGRAAVLDIGREATHWVRLAVILGAMALFVLGGRVFVLAFRSRGGVTGRR
jgi:hypothetical protein